jgi:cold shock CspA family protein
MERLFGIIVWFDRMRNFGFIQAYDKFDDETDRYFFHAREFVDKHTTIEKGARVTFTSVTTHKGLNAREIEML